MGPSVYLPLVAASSLHVHPVPQCCRCSAGCFCCSPCCQGQHHKPGRQQGREPCMQTRVHSSTCATTNKMIKNKNCLVLGEILKQEMIFYVFLKHGSGIPPTFSQNNNVLANCAFCDTAVRDTKDFTPRFVNISAKVSLWLTPSVFCFCVWQLQSEWEAVSLELEQWAVCVRQLEDVLVLQTLLLVPPPQGTAGGAATQCSIKMLLEGGTGKLWKRTWPDTKGYKKVIFTWFSS